MFYLFIFFVLDLFRYNGRSARLIWWLNNIIYIFLPIFKARPIHSPSPFGHFLRYNRDFRPLRQYSFQKINMSQSFDEIRVTTRILFFFWDTVPKGVRKNFFEWFCGQFLLLPLAHFDSTQRMTARKTKLNTEQMLKSRITDYPTVKGAETWQLPYIAIMADEEEARVPCKCPKQSVGWILFIDFQMFRFYFISFVY